MSVPQEFAAGLRHSALIWFLFAVFCNGLGVVLLRYALCIHWESSCCVLHKYGAVLLQITTRGTQSDAERTKTNPN